MQHRTQRDKMSEELKPDSFNIAARLVLDMAHKYALACDDIKGTGMPTETLDETKEFKIAESACRDLLWSAKRLLKVEQGLETIMITKIKKKNETLSLPNS